MCVQVLKKQNYYKDHTNDDHQGYLSLSRSADSNMRPVATSCFCHDSSYVLKAHSEMASWSKAECLNKVIQSCLEFFTVILTLV